MSTSETRLSAPSRSAAVPARKTWRVGLATRIAIGFVAAFIFGIAALLISLPYLFGGGDRAAGDRTADAIIAVTALVMAGFGVFLVFALVAIVRTRITLEGSMLDATVVGGHNRLLVPRFRSVRLAVSDIRSVERRTEIFRQLGLSSMRDALSIVTASGERIGLFSNTLGSAQTLPLDDVANAIASAAGVAVTDDGTVRTRRSGLYGAASSSWIEQPLSEANADKARNGVVLTAQIVTALLLLTVVLRACF